MLYVRAHKIFIYGLLNIFFVRNRHLLICKMPKTLSFPFPPACGKVSGMTQFTSGDNINCYLASSCTQFTCCMDDLVIQRPVDIQFTLDNCNFNLHVKIEKRAVDISLLDYKWGKVTWFLQSQSYKSFKSLNIYFFKMLIT